MGVDVIWRDEAGREVDAVLDLEDHFADAIRAAQMRRTNLSNLVRIDLYRDTIVMPPQTEALAAELENVRAEASAAARVHLGRIIQIARACSPGSYLECHGD